MSPGYKGAYTAIVTPFTRDGRQIDLDGMRALCEFQAEYGISGIVSVGTTGETPTLTSDEHNNAFRTTFDAVGSKVTVIASTGSNSTAECIEGTKHANDIGIRHVLLVDPYYNGPSSLEIRREYLEPVAAAFPETSLVPYIIPGRSGTQLLPQDLALASERCRNIGAVKEATGDFANMKLTRKLCGKEFSILSGDDDKTLQMMLDADIKSSGVISVVSNVAPRSVQDMCQYALEGHVEKARQVANALQPLFEVVTVKTVEETSRGQVAFKARNPLPIKSLMGVLGLPGGPLRPPLGKMTEQGLNLLLSQARKIQEQHPEVFEPLGKFFDVDVAERLTNERFWQGWAYDGY
jgi:4-hydroxy-tetrahydrodipicolinate synthase